MLCEMIKSTYTWSWLIGFNFTQVRIIVWAVKSKALMISYDDKFYYLSNFMSVLTQKL